MSANFNYRSGLSSAGAYQLSGVPYMSGSGATIPGGMVGPPYQVTFPYITKWITVENTGGTALRVGFSDLGVQGISENAYFTIPAASAGNPLNRLELDVRVKDIYLFGDGDTTTAQIAAGLTLVPVEQLTGTNSNWSGSSGVG